MKTNKFLSAICGFSMFISLQTAMGQDMQLSQYDASPILLNPALTGMKQNLKYRIVQQYRNQWDAVTRKSFLSSALAYDMNMQQKWGAGAYLVNDNSSRIYNSFSFVLSGAHDITIGNQDKQHLSIGLQAGFIYKTLRLSQYSYDKQYFQGGFDNDLPSGENFERGKRLMPEVNFGFAYTNTDDSKKYHPYGGIAVMHCTNPKNNFLEEADVSHLPLRYVINGGSLVELNDKITLDPKLLIMKQNTAWQFNPGVLVHYTLESSDLHLMGGLFYRVNDAVITQVGLFYKNFIYRISYDFNVSKLKTYSQYKGGIEFSITFFRTGGSGSKFQY
jgi:type IX secretion system PorP/SprF family membrane protein